MKKKTRNSAFLILTALIWGLAFVSQSEGGNAVGAYSFNCIRSLIGSAVLIPVIFLLDRFSLTGKKPKTKSDRKKLWLGGTCCGIVLFVASNLQQLGITMGTPVGKAGFLTTCYIVFVPILGVFIKKKCRWNVWLGVVLTVVGLYLLCINASLRLQLSDLLVLLCAFVFSVHILVIDRFSPLVDGVRMSCIQFLVCGVLSSIPMFFIETGHTAQSFHAWLSAFSSTNAWLSILYAGVCSCGIAYTLQIVGQQEVNPTVASLLMSLESVFSVLAGWLFLGQRLSPKELGGCLLIFAAVVLAQISFGKKKRSVP